MKLEKRNKSNKSANLRDSKNKIKCLSPIDNVTATNDDEKKKKKIHFFLLCVAIMLVVNISG